MSRLYAVDDDRAFLEIIESVATPMGFDVVTVDKSKQFQSIYRGEADAIVLIDIIMPDMDGIEVMNWMTAGKPPGAIIFVSGYGDHYPDMAFELARDRGLKHIERLLKPIKIATLRKAFEDARAAVAGAEPQR
ncbi:MAG TPA: response regulator [Alphaproteobacteria bacterium]|jgi:FixJ family two-component response regulator|nr:response regulator [Alphaproteobacteria bacterium]